MEQRQPFRFRLPWITALAPPRPTPEPQPLRPAVEIQAPAQPTTALAPQRPPFRPVQLPPPQPQAPPRTESQPSSPSRVGTESRVASQPGSPTRPMTERRPASMSPSLPRVAIQTAPQPQQEPSSPLRTATRMQPTDVVSQPRLPPKVSETTLQETSQPQEPKLAASQQFQEPQPKTGMTTSAPIKADTAMWFSGTEKISKEIEGKKVMEEAQKEDKPEEQKKAAEEVMKEKKDDRPASEDPMQKAITKLLTTASGLGAQTKGLVSAAFPADGKQQEKQEVSEKKHTLETSKSNERQIKTVRSTPSNSHQKRSMLNGERDSIQKEVRDDILKFVNKLSIGQSKQPLDGKPASITTLTGENRGASMHLATDSAKKDGSVHIHRGYKLNPDDTPETTTDGEGSSKERKAEDPMIGEGPATKAYINSNVQSINNSIVFESSVNERSPGVNLDFSQNPAEPTKPSTKPEPLETHKAEYNITPSQKLTYDSKVRRRCLRGLFLESSDSDPDNPDKPRRHGCRYSCSEKNKHKEMGIL